MSWSGFKKAVNRAGVQVMLKAGQLDESTDTEFDYLEKRYRTMESSMLRLHKDLRLYKDSLRALTTAQAGVTEVLADFYGAEENNIAHVYHNAMKDIITTGVDELEHPFSQTVLNPIERFNSYYMDVNEAIKKRAHKKLDYDSLQNKVRRLSDIATLDPASTEALDDTKYKEAEKQFHEAEEKYTQLNAQLKEELPELIAMRIPYLNPSFEAFVKIQLRFFNENFARIDQVQKKLDAQTREDFASGKLEERMDEILGQIKKLNLAL